jgi:hypothetical protein
MNADCVCTAGAGLANIGWVALILSAFICVHLRLQNLLLLTR